MNDWTQNAKNTVWDRAEYARRHATPKTAFSPNRMPVKAAVPECACVAPDAPPAQNAPVSKIALLETQLAQAEDMNRRLQQERAGFKTALEIANRLNDEQDETIRDLRAGMDAIRELIARTVPPSGRGLLVDLRTALAQRGTTAPHGPEQAGESEHHDSEEIEKLKRENKYLRKHLDIQAATNCELTRLIPADKMPKTAMVTLRK